MKISAKYNGITLHVWSKEGDVSLTTRKKDSIVEITYNLNQEFEINNWKRNEKLTGLHIYINDITDSTFNIKVLKVNNGVAQLIGEKISNAKELEKIIREKTPYEFPTKNKYTIEEEYIKKTLFLLQEYSKTREFQNIIT